MPKKGPAAHGTITKGTNLHVIPSPNGKWTVKRADAERASKKFDTQADALNWARSKGKNERSEVVIHRRDGTIREWDTFGPPRDKDSGASRNSAMRTPRNKKR